MAGQDVENDEKVEDVHLVGCTSVEHGDLVGGVDGQVDGAAVLDPHLVIIMSKVILVILVIFMTALFSLVILEMESNGS